MNDPFKDALEALQTRFVNHLPTRLQAIRNQCRQLQETVERGRWPNTEIDALSRLLHDLAGAAGTFGLARVSVLAIEFGQQLDNFRECGEAQGLATLETAFGRFDLGVVDAAANEVAPLRGERKVNGSAPPLVYVVEDDVAQSAPLAQALLAEGYRVREFADLDGFMNACEQDEWPKAVIMDMIFPEGKEAGARAISLLRSDITQPPAVIFLSVRDDLEARLAAFRAGASRYIVKPVDTARLARLLDDLTMRVPAQPYRVLLVDDDPQLLQAQALHLRQAGMTVHTLDDPLQVMAVLRSFEPDVVVLDVYMPEATGPELAAVLREQEEFTYLPILFLSAETDISMQLLALNLGGDDFLVKPIRPAHLVAAVSARARRARLNAELGGRVETLLYERERVHQALDGQLMLARFDAHGLIRSVNERLLAATGYMRDELLGRDYRTLASSLQQDAFYREMGEVVARGDIWRGRLAIRRRDGTPLWVDISLTPFLDAEGSVYEYHAMLVHASPGVSPMGEAV
ncbi:hypothetical protein BI364_07915 [Acidihalobacter yilgarnensis]|uniref:Response regulator n=1 Tax=Acidihalobacter yilgarnensis TaxID=2819280 RepID=A0A1D8IN47_9GAMM|nr:response regulator [Acidihalobacter yilgarnensis]AOU97899.1 hypothetical protein BI364_07915 [Acidihalobacter yilgarnensis]